MIVKWIRRAYRRCGWPLLVAGLLTACGGGAGIVALVEIVTPIAGNWVVNGTSDRLDFNSDPNSDLFNTTVNVTASMDTSSGVCIETGSNATGIALEGTIDNGALVLRRVSPPNNTTPCLQGTFTDLITLKAGPPGGVILDYENQLGVDVQMGLGLWISDGGGQLKLKFEQPFDLSNNGIRLVTGCDLSSGSPERFDDTSMNGFNTSTRAKPFIAEIRSPISGPLFTQVVFEDGATLTALNASGQPVTLRRTADTTTTCP